MPNILGLAGAQPQKATRFAPIYTGRWSSGLWTNRSPLRDANTNRLTEKFYGASGDALIAGLNVEITNRLTLARRPGNTVFDASNTYTNVKRFYDFRVFSATQEEINVIVDQADALYSLYNGVKKSVWTKASGAGQSFLQSVGNSLYWGDGVSNKKWLQTLTTWSSNARWNTPTTPFLSTFLIDPNGNIQQLIGTTIPVTHINVTSNVLTVTSSVQLSGFLGVGMDVEFPSSMTATFLEFQTVTVTAVNGKTFTASFANANYDDAETSDCTETSGGISPESGSAAPTWSTVVPSASNGFQGGVTQDGMVRWANRGNPVMNWGITAPTSAPAPTVGTSRIAWQANTYYSGPGVIIDPQGNLQQVSVAGLSGASAPSWSTSLHGVTVDGTVRWIMIQSASSLTWAAHTSYKSDDSFTLTAAANATNGNTVYTGDITNGDSNAFAGRVFIVSKFSKDVNNGVFVCAASTATQLTLQNGSGASETAQANATANPSYVIGNAYGTNCLYYPAGFDEVTLVGNVSAYLYPGNTSGAVGCFTLQNPTTLNSAMASATTMNSLNMTGSAVDNGSNMVWATVDGSGATVGTTNPFPGYTHDYQMIALATLNVPVAGQYSFTISHHDAMLWGIGNGATLVTGTTDNPITPPLNATAAQGYPVFGGTNRGLEGGGVWTDTFVVNFPTPGEYPLEIDFAFWYHSGLQLNVQCNGVNLANGTPSSGATAPIWPSWSTSYAPEYPSVTEANGVIQWYNVGPVTDFTWYANTNFTTPSSSIIDPQSNYEFPYRTGVSGTTAPTFSTGINSLTTDNPNLTWINDGPATTIADGTVSTFNGGWKYCLALANTLDDTVSNATPLSLTTGDFIGADGVTFQPGEGLDLSSIDPQADYVAIFRTTDGESTPFLIPGEFTTYTLPLATYLSQGYVDTTPDTELDNLISAPINGENTPAGVGAQNLTYHLNRIFFSVGNTVYWTAGPATPCGNGVNGIPPDNYDTFPSLVKRIVPTTTGAMVFTVSDVYLIQGTGTTANPIQNGIPIIQGVGLQNYNALDVNGSIIGFFTTDSQFVILDPSAGVSNVGFPIADQFRLNNGAPGQSWNPANVYVAWYVNGDDQGWYVADGENGWFRLMTTPAPETGYTWSPFARVAGGCNAVQSIEVSPGSHRLLLGPTGTGSLLMRDLSSSLDSTSSFPAYAVIGSAVLAQPGQVATVSFITTDSINVGTPLTLGLLLDEALPYYQGAWNFLTVYENDPPNFTPSSSILGQRFYLSENYDTAAAVCRHMQIQVQWPSEAAANELLSLTIFGGFMQEG